MPVTLVVAGKTDVGKVRTNNEDTFLIADLSRSSKMEGKEQKVDLPEEGILLAVSDGMGGEQAGEVASALVVESLYSELKRRRTSDAAGQHAGHEALTKKIEEAVARANKEVWKAAKEPGKHGMGATLTGIFLHDTVAYIAEIGDSRAYVIRGKRVRQITKDQSFVQLLVDSGALTEAEAKNYPHKNIILQAMGQKPEVSAALGKLDLRRHDRFVVCSDGLSNKVTAEEMLDIVLQAKTLGDACEKLVATANERGGEDNITVVICEVSGEDLLPYRDSESVTQTYEVVKDFTGGPVERPRPVKPKTETAEAEPKDEPTKEEPAKEEAAEAKEPPKKDDDEDEADINESPVGKDQPGDLSTRPQQMIVAALMIAVGLVILWQILKG